MALPIKPSAPNTPIVTPALKSKVSFSAVEDDKKGQRVVLYGTGGIGKTTLACLAPGPVVFIDLDESLPILKRQLKSSNIPLPQTLSCSSWDDVRNALKSDGWDKIKTIVIDTATKLEEFAVKKTLQSVKRENNSIACSIEDYGYGKGFGLVFDIFLPILGDLDRHIRAGRNVILISHECTCSVPNPGGADWIRYEPRLQSPSSGKASIRHRLKEWADHVLFLSYDVNAAKGKAEGHGSRTLFSAELPAFMAKSRTTAESFTIEIGSNPWNEILK